MTSPDANASAFTVKEMLAHMNGKLDTLIQQFAAENVKVAVLGQRMDAVETVVQDHTVQLKGLTAKVASAAGAVGVIALVVNLAAPAIFH